MWVGVLEAFLALGLCGQLSSVARQRGRHVRWGLLGALLWVVGSFAGRLVANFLDLEEGAYYALALCGALLGAVTAVIVVSRLRFVERPGVNVPPEQPFRGTFRG